MPDVLDFLADGNVHSGQELAQKLSVSRTAVWKQISRWRSRGLDIEVLPGRGYCWRTPVEWWSAEALCAQLSPTNREALKTLRIVRELSSTNDEVLALRQSGLPTPLLVLAEVQQNGRGRRGRQWHAPLGSGFCGSLGWRFSNGFAALDGLSLAVGVAIVRALRRYGVDGIGLKWPNDVMVGAAKLGGVLIEAQAEANGSCHVVIGVGLNFVLPSGFSDLLERNVTDVRSCLGVAIERNRLGGALIDELMSILTNYESVGFGAYQAEWVTLDVLRGRHVRVDGLDQPLSGIALGVDERGCLLVDTGNGRQKISAGEVSLQEA